jgi:hypothetical protein
MKYYMYNRFKSPDINLLHNKSITHIFFTRPDLNIISGRGDAATLNPQAAENGESSVTWARNRDIFMLLVDRKRAGSDNNFNLLLSNQITSIDISDESLSTIDAGQSWGGHAIIYGDSYSGTKNGQFSCTFTETSDYSIINLMKLWITYIDNVSKGIWKPSYNLHTGVGVYKHAYSSTASHVYTRTLDYASSCYVFKCGPDGEDILYWTKYYGVFPTNTGASALGWDSSSNIGDSIKLNIQFRYSFKRDLNLISLLEFNRSSVETTEQTSINSYKDTVAGATRPYVGHPFIHLDLEGSQPSVRLKFHLNTSLSDDEVYRSNLSGRGIRRD